MWSIVDHLGLRMAKITKFGDLGPQNRQKSTKNDQFWTPFWGSPGVMVLGELADLGATGGVPGKGA